MISSVKQKTMITVVFCCFVAGRAQAAPAKADENVTNSIGFLSTADSLKFELSGLFILTTFTGFVDWKWGTASFRFNSEGWFGMDTGSGGQDKIGHLYSTYLVSEFLYLRLRNYYAEAPSVTVYPPLFSWMLMFYVEVFDGFSVDHGFAYEDLVMDTIGVGISYLRKAFPKLADILDIRLEYFPSRGMQGFHPIIDYSGQKFIAVVKLAGFGLFPYSPLHYLELQLGYYTRGFMKSDEEFFAQKSTVMFFGLGISLEQLIFGRLENHFGTPFDYVNALFGYFQIPYSYIPFTVNKRSSPR